MPRADLLVHLVKAAREGDDPELRRTVESMIAEERGKQHHLVAELLEEAVRGGSLAGVQEISESQQGFGVKRPVLRLEDLFLSDRNRTAVGELIEEQQRAEV